MVLELNENTVDEYTAQLDKWAYGLVEKMEGIPKQYAEITGKVAEIDAKLVSVGYGPESQVLKDEKAELLYGVCFNWRAKKFTELDKLSVEARYFPIMFYKVLNNFGVNGGLFATHLKSEGLLDRFVNQLADLNNISKDIDEDTRSQYINENKFVLDSEASLELPIFNFDSAKYESLLAKKIGLSPEVYESISAQNMEKQD
ncbi:MAG: hypothetical protein K0B07_00600 [DPANN group archaeon]|nr:hypothetical protein [DPANN group archaeon]